MATLNHPTDEPPALRRDSPSPELAPTPAIGPCPELSRCLSATSTISLGSNMDITPRDSLGSDTSRLSSGSYRSRSSDISSVSSRRSSYHIDAKGRRRGFMRPQGTDFAASARSRESVLSLGSIAHIQYYFARTGLLDGKGAQLARKRKQQGALDLADLESNPVSPTLTEGGYPSYSPLGASPDLSTANFGSGRFVESPVDEGPMEPDFYYDDLDEPDPNILPPTVSTYHRVEKPVPRPPTIEELKSNLKGALDRAYKSLKEVKDGNNATSKGESDAPDTKNSSPRPKTNSQGWFEIQGMHILDVMTFAIRAAKMYYTAHEKPDRLDAIKAEKEVRADLLTVMEVLKHAATRDFVGGIRNDEVASMEVWLNGVSDMLHQDEEVEEAERQERASWSWLNGDWTGREVERELAFIKSMDPDAEPLPEFTSAQEATELPTPFLKEMQNGLRLVNLHNAAVCKSQRRFGTIPTFHTDTQKPYRAADNIRYWAKAAELRWEVTIKVDALGIVYNNSPQVWINFQEAILKWCRTVREEITGELSEKTA